MSLIAQCMTDKCVHYEKINELLINRKSKEIQKERKLLAYIFRQKRKFLKNHGNGDVKIILV